MQSKQEIHRLNQLRKERVRELETLAIDPRDTSLMMAMQMSGLAWWKWDLSQDVVSLHGLPDVFPATPDGDFSIAAQDWYLLLDPADVAGFNESLERYQSRGSDVWTHECRIQRLDGSRRWVEIRGYLCQEPVCGAHDCLVGTIQDIDERKRGEQKLSLQQEYLIEGSRVADLSAWVYHPESQQVDWSEGVYQIYGLPSGEEPSFVDCLNYYVEADRARLSEALQVVERSGQSFDMECELISADGIHKFVRVIGKRRRAENDDGYYLVGVIQDVSKQSTMRRGMETFLKMTPDLIGAIDFRMRLVELSPSWQALTGWSRYEMMQRGLAGIVHDDDRAQFAAAIDRAIASKTKENLECRLVSKRGELHWVSWHIFADSSLRLVFISARDESESKRIKSALLAAKNEADAASRAKSNILAAVSHELRTPLNPILGFSDLLIEETENQEHLDMLRSINEAGERLTNVVGEMLDFAKVDSGGETVSDDTFSVHALLEAQIEKLIHRLQLDRSQIQFKSAESPNVSPDGQVVGDETKICRVIGHLVENAVKFSANPLVTIDSELIASDSGSVLWHVDIHDNGIGIHPESLENIFEPFHLVDDSYTRSCEGTGLGLAICKRYVELMGGRLAVRSKLGQGSTFSFFLPLRAAERAPSGGAQSTQECARLFERGLKVFMVEDNPSNLYYQSTLLEDLGCELTSVSSGELAMVEYEPKNYDCVLLDLHMPRVGGVHVLKWMRAAEEKAGIEPVPIIILSADIMPSARATCIELGADSFVSKPVSPQRLQQALCEVLCDR